MNVRSTVSSSVSGGRIGWIVLVLTLATAIGAALDWAAPGLDLYCRDVLMRVRGTTPPPTDIAIIAIDQASISQLGQYPWNRAYTARVLDTVGQANPKAIGLDLLFSEPTDPAADAALTGSIQKAGDVVLAERLIRRHGQPDHGRTAWMGSIPEVNSAAAGIGHANLETEDDGTARGLALRLGDTDGTDRWALALEMIRVGDHLPPGDISQNGSYVHVDDHRIPYWQFDSYDEAAESPNQNGGQGLPPHMNIDYSGPTGTFSSRTVSFYDVLSGRVDPSYFAGKYVLIGVTAPAISNRLSTPFVRSYDTNGDRQDDLMPEVEVLANTLSTATRGRYYHGVSDLSGIISAAAAAMAAIFLMGMAQGRHEAIRTLMVLFTLVVVVLTGSYLLFAQYSIFPPLVPVLGSLAVAVPLSLLRRSLLASSYLDRQIDELLMSENQLLRSSDQARREAISHRGNGNVLPNGRRLFPRDIEWRTNTLGALSRDLIERTLFVDSALRSLEEGLVIADNSGAITFANEKAAQMLGLPGKQLIGSDLIDTLRAAESDESGSLYDASSASLRESSEMMEREVILRSFPGSVVLRLSPVIGGERIRGERLGFVVTLTDITYYRQLQKTQSEVLTLVTHELRSPLTAIQGMSEVLADHHVDADDTVKMASAINVEAKRLARLITEYLDLTKLESGIQTDRFVAVRLRSVLDEVLTSLGPVAERRGINVVADLSDEDPVVFGNGQMLSVAFGNVIENAIKYSPDNTKIEIKLSVSGSTANVSVLDQGYGIESEQIPLIFGKFYRYRHRTAAEPPGSGLGLALTQEIVELHEGRIGVTSKLGSGSTFTISLPLMLQE